MDWFMYLFFAIMFSPPIILTAYGLTLMGSAAIYAVMGWDDRDAWFANDGIDYRTVVAGGKA